MGQHNFFSLSSHPTPYNPVSWAISASWWWTRTCDTVNYFRRARARVRECVPPRRCSSGDKIFLHSLVVRVRRETRWIVVPCNSMRCVVFGNSLFSADSICWRYKCRQNIKWMLDWVCKRERQRVSVRRIVPSVVCLLRQFWLSVGMRCTVVGTSLIISLTLANCSFARASLCVCIRECAFNC